jgi:hypothetical protein
MLFRVTTDLKVLAHQLRPSLQALLAGRLTDEGLADVGDGFDAIFGTRNPYEIARILEFVGYLYALERGNDDDI